MNRLQTWAIFSHEENDDLLNVFFNFPFDLYVYNMYGKVSVFVCAAQICLGTLSVSWSGQCVCQLGVSAAVGCDYVFDISECVYHLTSSKIAELVRR